MITHAYFLVLKVGMAAPGETRHFSAKFCSKVILFQKMRLNGQKMSNFGGKLRFFGGSGGENTQSQKKRG